MNQNHVFSNTFPSEISRVKQIVIEILEFLRAFFPFISKEEESDIKLIFSELLYNAAIHGNKENADKNVKVIISVMKNHVHGYIKCEIADEGIGFNHKKLINSLKTTDSHALPESDHGRGVLIAASLTDNFAYNGKGNVISFSKHINCTPLLESHTDLVKTKLSGRISSNG